MAITYTTVSSQNEVSQILDLQSRNLINAISTEKASSQGFVTVKHDPDVLWRMNQSQPAVIAKFGNEVAGYALIMPPEFAAEVPILAPFFDLLTSLGKEGKFNCQARWFVMGQICVSEHFRGQGVFDGLYEHLKLVCRGYYDFTVTEVSDRNKRSLRAHERVGFEEIYQYQEDLTGETWHVIRLEF